MELIIWLVITIPCGLLFTGLGIYAWRLEKPMWFWSGSTVRPDQITDVKAYNRENGIMWICYSLVFWVTMFLGFRNISGAGGSLCFWDSGIYQERGSSLPWAALGVFRSLLLTITESGKSIRDEWDNGEM